MYYELVGGTYPSKTVPRPAEVLDDYMRYEGVSRRVATWHCWSRSRGGARSKWSTPANIEAIHRQPARKGKAWYVSLQAVPKAGTVLRTCLAGRIVG